MKRRPIRVGPGAVAVLVIAGGLAVWWAATRAGSSHGLQEAPPRVHATRLDAPSTSAPPETAPPSKSAPTNDRVAIARVVHAWSTLHNRYESGALEWDESKAARLLTGTFLTDARRDEERWSRAGNVAVAPPQSIADTALEVTRVDGTTATVSECQIDDRVVTAADGTVLDDRVGTYHLVLEMRRTARGWRIARLVSSSVVVGAADCRV